MLTEGCSWRAIDRPQARWNSVYQYFRRRCQRGVLKKVLTQFGPELAPGWHLVDSTHVKVHADGSNPAGGQASHGTDQGRSQHQDSCPGQRALASSRHCLVRWEPSRHLSLAEELRECLPEGSTLIGDKAYDSSTLRQTAATKGIKTCIPARTNRTTTVPFSATVYRRRHRVENFFERIKRYRRVATRYDKLAETFLGFVCLAILFTLRLT